MTHSQAAKRRWKPQRDQRAKRLRMLRRFWAQAIPKIETPYGTLRYIAHPLFQ